jgi:hypothetical protein
MTVVRRKITTQVMTNASPFSRPALSFRWEERRGGKCSLLQWLSIAFHGAKNEGELTAKSLPPFERERGNGLSRYAYFADSILRRLNHRPVIFPPYLTLPLWSESDWKSSGWTPYLENDHSSKYSKNTNVLIIQWSLKLTQLCLFTQSGEYCVTFIHYSPITMIANLERQMESCVGFHLYTIESVNKTAITQSRIYTQFEQYCS